MWNAIVVSSKTLRRWKRRQLAGCALMVLLALNCMPALAATGRTSEASVIAQPHATASESKISIAWWEGAAGALLSALLGALLGCLVPLYVARRSRRTERGGEVVAMMIELDLAEENMRALLKENVAAPLYHLPLAQFQSAAPKLIGEGLLETDEMHAVLAYMMRIEELNRGLERARSAAAAYNLADLQSEYDRNRMKVVELIDQKQEWLAGATLYDAVAAALSRLDL